MHTMKITSKGQVTIPQELRERAGLMPGCEVARALTFFIEQSAAK
jgi:bifunctional DNA-binding transcriptional regulator/antitoxin component of YhaV-PrlF toxin-antitoxin module